MIFCFPPFLGYSFVYTALASYLPDYTLCCFHFQDMNELLQVMMNRQQPGVPFILMGYSFGGNLAFEVAAALEAEGQEVADIILVDSYRRLKAAEKTQEELEAMIDDAIGSIDMTLFGENAAFVDIIKEQTRHKMLHYAKYMNGKIDRGQVNARIHLLKSENDEENVDAASLSRDWENNTSNQFTIYQGKGVHADMLDGQYLSHNAAYLQAILQQAQQVYNQPNGIEQMI
jgi:thioesterase domain-containing protein